MGRCSLARFLDTHQSRPNINSLAGCQLPLILILSLQISVLVVVLIAFRDGQVFYWSGSFLAFSGVLFAAFVEEVPTMTDSHGRNSRNLTTKKCRQCNSSSGALYRLVHLLHR